jgi:hypothetical protein
MIIYETLKDGALKSDTLSYIPIGHRLYQQAQQEVIDGEATINPYVEPLATQQGAKDAINIAAGHARGRIESIFVSPGYGTSDEYNNTALEVERWRDAGSPAGDVPESITSWAIPKGITNEQAATDLEAQEALLRSKLDAVRTLRLAGTVAVDDATSDWDTVAQSHIDNLNNYDPLA